MIGRSWATLAIAALVGSLLAAGMGAAQARGAPKPNGKAEPKPPATSPADDYYELQRLLVDTLDQVERNYVKNVTRRELVEAAIKGVLDRLDPYSTYIGPKELPAFRSSVESEFGGIGIQVTVEGGYLRVISPLVGTPAYRAGVVAGDRIVEIDGKPTAGMTIDQAIRRLKGEVGTKVTLTILHPGKSQPEKLTIVRESIHVETVLGDRRNADDTWDYLIDHERRIGYVRLIAFGRDTARDLRQVLERLQRENLRGLILDLRFNPGGLLSSATEVCDLFVAEGRIVSVKGRNTPERSWNAHREGTFLGFPMVVLINRFSASASEIVAACLQDHHRAVVMGERSWGKGSVQNVIELENGQSALKLTTASYLRPNGKNIDRHSATKGSDEWGVTPDKGYELKLSDTELQRLVEDRRQRDIVQPKRPAPSPPAKPEPAKTEPAKPDPAKNPPEAKSDPEPSKSLPTAKPDASKVPDAPVSPDVSLEHVKFVDPQLRMALDYLAGELARAK